MLTVCGITYDHTSNYGSCLQAYALKRAIEKITIDGESCEYSLIPIKTFKEFPVRNRLKSIIIKPLNELHRLQFKDFEKKHMTFVDINSFAELKALNNKTDAFICGSDVIWNPDFNMGIDAFYLNFAEKYKFSYAASFGKIEIPEISYQRIGNYLKSFDSISVREETGADIVKKCCGRDAIVVADPVLLLDREEWEMIIDKKTIKDEEKYIFVYTTHINENINRFIDKIVKQTGFKVISSTCGPKQALRQKILQVQKPEKWLQLLRDAEYIVTNSFHATVFSVIFHKKFFTVVQGDRFKGINVRMNDFLNAVGLKDRIYDSLPDKINEDTIEYELVDSNLALIRNESHRFLEDNLNNAFKRKKNKDSI